MKATDRKQIEVFIKPKSVAVIGALDRPISWGSFIMRALLTWKFPGRIYPITRRTNTVAGIRAFPDITSIQDKVDLAVLAIRAESVPDIIKACAMKGVRGIIIITAGFAETGAKGRKKEEELSSLARRYGVRLLGPNVSGTFNLHDRFNAAASPAQLFFPSYVTAICQGGYAFYDLLSSAYSNRMGVGQFIHTGNECDLQATDFLEYFADDPRTRVIIMYLEGIRDIARFREVAARVSKRKPIIVYKAGRTSNGTRAARSHTGAIAGNARIYDSLFRQLNVIQSPFIENLIPLAYAFVDFPSMKGNRVAIVTIGGSWGVVLTDTLEEKGLKVPELSMKLQRKLRRLGMPMRASTLNPIDLGAAGPLNISAENVIQIAREILQSPQVDALILHGLGRPGMGPTEITMGWQAMLDFEKKVMREYSHLMKEFGKPVILGSHQLSWQSQAVFDLIKEDYRVFHRIDEIGDLLALKYLYEYRSQKRD